MDNLIAVDEEGTNVVLILYFSIGLLSLILIVATIVTVTVCNRMRRRNKSLTRYTNTINYVAWSCLGLFSQPCIICTCVMLFFIHREIQEYEMISKYSAVRHDSNSLPDRYSAIKKRDSNRKQPILPPAHLAADYLTPTMTKTTGSESIENPETNSDTISNHEEEVRMDESKDLDSEFEPKEEKKAKTTSVKESDENPYQSLIVASKANATTITIDGYVKIIRSRVGSLEGQESLAPKPPPIPPKPEPDCSLKSSIPQLSLASDLSPMTENMYANRSGTL
jgi:hypothetical protein